MNSIIDRFGEDVSHAGRGREPFQRGGDGRSQQQFLRLGVRLCREDADCGTAGSGGRLLQNAGELQRTVIIR